MTRASQFITSLVAGDGTTGSTDGVSATFWNPVDILVFPNTATHAGVADANNHRIRRVELSNGQTETVAGSSRGFEDGTSDCKFNYPAAISPHHGRTADDSFFVADMNNHRIRKVHRSAFAMLWGGVVRRCKNGLQVAISCPHTHMLHPHPPMLARS